MKKRIISAAVIIPLTIAAIWIGGLVFDILAVLITAGAVWEMNKVLKLVGIRTHIIINMVFVAAAALLIYFGKEAMMFQLFILFSMLTLAFTLFSKKHDIRDALSTIAVFVYPSSLILTLTLIMRAGREYLIAGILTSVITDTAAFFVGRKYGRRKLCPTISPHKTLAGAIGGELFATVLMSIYGLIVMLVIRKTGFDFVKLIGWSSFAMFGGIFAQFGDLCASAVKRYCGVKDYSNLIPGHGGIMDRLDSVMFTSALLYLFLSLGII